MFNIRQYVSICLKSDRKTCICQSKWLLQRIFSPKCLYQNAYNNCFVTQLFNNMHIWTLMSDIFYIKYSLLICSYNLHFSLNCIFLIVMRKYWVAKTEVFFLIAISFFIWTVWWSPFRQYPLISRFFQHPWIMHRNRIWWCPDDSVSFPFPGRFFRCWCMGRCIP